MAFLSQLKPQDFEKKPGDVIESAKWNALGTEVIELGQAKVDRSGDTIQGDLRVTGTTTLSSTLAVAGNVGIGTPDPRGRLEVSGPDQAGTGTIRSSGTTVTGTNSLFAGELQIGDRITANGQTRTVTEVRGNLTLIVDQAFSSAINGETFTISRLGLLVNQGNVGIGTTNPGVKLSISGQHASASIGTSEILRLLRPAIGGVKYANSVDLRVGSFENNLSGRTRLDIALSGTPGASNGSGTVPDVTVMTLLGTGNVGIGTATPGARLGVAVADNEGTNPLAIAKGASTYLSVLNNGNVGIGTASPGAKLDVNGNVTISNNGTLSFGDQKRQTLNLLGTTYGIGVQDYTHYFRTGFHFAWYKGGQHSNTALDPGTGGTAQMVIRDSGNVGIGTASPSAKLDVNGTLKVSGTTTLNETVTIGLTTANRNLIVNGNVGIGTANPAQKLHVNGNIALEDGNVLMFRKASPSSYSIHYAPADPRLPLRFVGSSDSNVRRFFEFGNYTDDNIQKAWNPGVVIDSYAGNVGIGLTSPQAKLHVNGSLTVADAATLTGNVTIGSTAANGNRNLIVNGNVGIGTANPQEKLDVNGIVKATTFKGSGAGLTGLTANQIPDLSAAKITSDTLNIDRIPGLTADKITSGGTMANALTITSGGNVGIGTVGPAERFTVVVNNTSTHPVHIVRHVTNQSSLSYLKILNGGNVGIGTETPTAKLAVTVSATDTSTLPLKIEKGTTPYLTILNNGNVGIGTTSPAAKLEVNGSTNLNGAVTIGTTTANQNLTVNGTVTAKSFSGSGADLTNLDASKITAGTLDTARISGLAASKITSDGTMANALTINNGNVGIGTPNPGAKLDVSGTLKVASVTTLSGNVTIGSTAANGNRNLIVNGNVGIGTASPGVALEIVGSEQSGTGIIDNWGSADNTGIRGSGTKFKEELQVGDRITAAGQERTITVITSDTNLTVDNPFSPNIWPSRNFGFFKAAAGTLKVRGAIVPSPGSTSGNGIMFPTDPFGGTGDAAWIRYHNVRGGEKATLEIGISNDTDDHIVLKPSGNVGIGTDNPSYKLHVVGSFRVDGNASSSSAWAVSSDARIKTNPIPVAPLHSLQRLLGLTLYEYEYLPEFQPGLAGQSYHGFLAQEVEQVIPEAVSITGDHKLGEGRVIEGLRAVAHDRIFSEAVGAIQALYAMVQSQAARLRVLEEQVAAGQPA